MILIRLLVSLCTSTITRQDIIDAYDVDKTYR